MSDRKIFVAGHKGMVGSAICRHLAKDSDVTVLTAPRDELDLLSQILIYAQFQDGKDSPQR